MTALTTLNPQNFYPATLAMITTGKGSLTTINEVLQALGSQQILTIAEYRRREIKVGSLLCHAIATLQEQLGVSNKLEQSDIAMVANELVDEFCWLTFYDVAIVFRKARRGCYGNLYERLSMPKIFGWFREYAEERFNAAEQQSINRHNICKHGGHDIVPREEVQQWYAQQLAATPPPPPPPATTLQQERTRQLQKLATLYPETTIKQ